MSTPTIDLNVKNYITAVRAELDDLEPDVRDDLLEDLEAHLHEVAAEADGSLEDRLGPASAYAAELRASAGLPVRGERVGFVRRLEGRLHAIGSMPGMDRVSAYARELRPGWWLMRAYLFVASADILWTYSATTQLPLPSFGGNVVFGIFAIVGVAVVSVELGRASTTHRWARRLSIVASAIVVVMTIAAAAEIHDRLSAGVASPEEGYVSYGTLTHPDGAPIANICPYSSDGQPLSDVLLFDQDGRPISNPNLDELSRRRVANLYPYEQQTVDPETGATQPFKCPTLRRVVEVTPVPSASPAPTGSPVP